MHGPDFERKVDEAIARYPEARAAVMPILHLFQDKDGYISLDAEGWTAKKLGMSNAYVHGVVTFYTMYRTAPVGKYLLQVCTTVSCMLRGCDRLLEHIKRKLDIDVGETTADGLFTLVRVECLGSCGTVPMMQVNDDYYEDLDIARTDELLEGLARGEKMKPGPGPKRVYVE